MIRRWLEGRRGRATVPSADVDRRLLLYKFDACPYCQRVAVAIERLGLDVPTRDTRMEPGARAELVRIAGGTQVPCLLIDDVPLLESADIVAWLEAYARR
ncbi:MAG: glutathione S-transferase N-terminal domain-containing protein [Alphaproteobacteria bacterium]|nr:glutathione S-transferase N-terminal domain-containing protein [Alphaproteobacteria bacterium]